MERSEVRSPSAGVNQQGLRDHNSRLILSMIQRHGALPGSDLARMAGLSPQTVSVILRELEQDGFLERGDPQRGRVGKPRVPMALAPGAAFSFGLKLGRRSADLVLADLLGRVRDQRHLTYRWPRPRAILDFLGASVAEMTAGLDRGLRGRVAGIGVAMPFEIWDWPESIGAPAEELGEWREADFAAAVAEVSGLTVHVENDATAACRAELVFGRGREFRDFAYVFVGAFIGGGVVLNHSVFDGMHGNAGAFGSLPARRPDGSDCQLIDTASLHLLESALTRAGHDPARLWRQPQDWSGFEPALSDWVEAAAPQIARAALTICSVIDFEAVLIDGGFPPGVRDRLVDRVRAALARLDGRGLSPVRVEAGAVGGNARALGAACGPIFAQYLLNTHGSLASA